MISWFTSIRDGKRDTKKAPAAQETGRKWRNVRWPGHIGIAVILALTLGYLALSSSTLTCGRQVHADADTIASQYCAVLPVAISTDGSTTLTFDPVRVPLNAAALIAVGTLDARAWDILPTTPGFTEIEVNAQNIASSAAPWWFTAPSIPVSSEVVYTVYMGNDEQKRDNGLGFYGLDSASAVSDSDFNLTDNFAVNVRMERLTGAPDHPATVFDRWTGGSGYEMTLLGSGRVQAHVDGQVCNSDPWDGALADWRMLYESPTLTLFKDGVISGSACNTGLGAIGVAAVNPTIGTLGNPLVIRDVSVRTNTTGTETPVARWSMNAIDCTETSWVNPDAAGTCPDFTGNGHTLTYAFERDQTGITVLVGAVSLTSSSALITLPSGLSDFLGSPFAGVLNEGTSVNENLPGFSIINAGIVAMGVPLDFGWAMLITMTALIVGVVSFVVTKNNILIGILLFLAVLILGNTNGAVERWYVALWMVIALLTLGAVQWSKGRG